MNRDIINAYINESNQIRTSLDIDKILEVYDDIYRRLINGKKVFLCGNGGSAADCQHFAAEMVCKFNINRESFPAIALTTDTSVLTAIGNDFGFEYIFRRQLEGLARSDDYLICLSTSGKSKNIIEAIKYANVLNMNYVLLTGANKPDYYSELTINVKSNKTSIIQETHSMILHILCKLIDKKYQTDIEIETKQCAE